MVLTPAYAGSTGASIGLDDRLSVGTVFCLKTKNFFI
jgi:hypothetical protein